MFRLNRIFLFLTLSKVKKKIVFLFKILLKQNIRRVVMRNDVAKVTFFNKGAKLRLFNLDLHIGVIRDLRQEIVKHKNVELLSWSISSHNGIVRKFLDIPDPVKFVNNKNWANLNIDFRNKFVEEYSGFLKSLMVS